MVSPTTTSARLHWGVQPQLKRSVLSRCEPPDGRVGRQAAAVVARKGLGWRMPLPPPAGLMVAGLGEAGSESASRPLAFSFFGSPALIASSFGTIHPSRIGSGGLKDWYCYYDGIITIVIWGDEMHSA